MATNYQDDFKIPFYLCDAQNNLRLSSLINLVIDCSGDQMDEWKLGPEFMAEQGWGWVITQYHVEIMKLPVVNQRIRVSTSVTAYNKYFSYRTYQVTTPAGLPLVSIQGAWILFDIAQRRMIRLPAVITEKLPDCYQAGLTSFPRVVKQDWSNSKEQQRYHVRYFDIDTNGHVNNSCYFDWLGDALAQNEQPILETPQLLDIKFEHEVLYRDIVSVKLKRQDHHVHMVVLNEAGQTAAEATLQM